MPDRPSGVDLCLFPESINVESDGEERENVPQLPVKADWSMLNFGSPGPPVDSVPLGLETCWMYC